MEQTIKYIGFVHSSLSRMEDCPKLESENAPEATLKILPEFVEGVKDIKPGQELILFTWLHFGERTTIKCHPRDNPESPLTGVFSTRSPDRPNPIGIHVVKVVSIVDKGLIKVDSLEVLDQTPLIDIKPLL
ncbi:MAG: tRNA (N6-threonylcarbamoyladenosine(37)-N6)-methyltransferase TrmO [Ferruginibacter sp.]|nr:tRNA (N6-threonylcarbamoyladenosine(37)-N6)-methyltransferase TrmO [Ferruginibacter sp.]